MRKGDLDIILYGATGLTGKMTAAHLVPYCVERGIRIGLAARSMTGLEKVRDDIGAPIDIPLIISSSNDPASLSAMVDRTACIVSAVGPYQLYGSELVRACVASGTDYLDVNGEPAWMAEMIATHEEEARSSGARIMFSCGFDSVPFDLGVYLLQDQMIQRTGTPCAHVSSRVRMQGIASGGSVRTNAASNHAVSQSVATAELMANPYALIPGFTGVMQPDMREVRRDERSGDWLAPFIMAPINSKSVHRTNHLLGHRYGRAFTYEEMYVAGGGDQGRENANRLSEANDILGYLGVVSATVQPKGDPAGFYEIQVFGSGSNGVDLQVHVRADHDPGYESTARIATQTVALLLETPHLSVPGGMWTAAAAFGGRLVEALKRESHIAFTSGEC